MYSRGCAYGRVYGIACSPIVPRHSINSRPQCDLELRQALLRRNHCPYQWISHRDSHAVAAEEDDKSPQDSESGPAIHGVRTNKPHERERYERKLYERERYERERYERERYSDLIARFLPRESQQPWRIQKYAFGVNKMDKLFINKLRLDQGPISHDWGIAFAILQKYYTPEKVDKPKDIDTTDHVPSLVHTSSSRTEEFDGSIKVQSPVPKVPSRSRIYRPFRLARDIPRPTEWSEAKLAIYVEALTRSQRTQSQIWAGKPRMRGWANIQDVVTALNSVLYSTASQKFLSIEACNTALNFYYRHGVMSKARSLYLRMEDLKMDIPTKTFNILLRGSASRMDLHNFTFLLNKMIRRGLKPNEETWELFVQVIDSSRVRAFIFQKMAEKKILDNIWIRRDVANHMMYDEIINHLGDGHDHHSFLDHMNIKYGIGWLSRSAGNKLLNEVAKRKSAAESLKLLPEMKQAGFLPDDISMNTLLRHCLPLRWHELILEILDNFKNLYGQCPGPKSYETLFLQAWRCRLPNFSTVVWRSACIDGAVSRKMEDLVFQNLLSYPPGLDKQIHSDDAVEPSSSSRTVKFKRFAGRFLTGVYGFEGDEVNQAMDSLGLDPQRRTIKWAQILLRSNLHVSRTCRLKLGLSQLLRQALTMDRTWAVEGLFKEDDWRKWLPHAITVDVRPKKRHQRRS